MDAPALPRVAIAFCTQCRWMLRAAYYAQELLSTFAGTTLGEVALQPATGGLFRVTIEWEVDEEETQEMPHFYRPGQVEGLEQPDAEVTVQGNEKKKRRRHVLLWDRKAESGFPETKLLKQRVRDCVQPDRGLGHSDVGGKAGAAAAAMAKNETMSEDTQSTQRHGTQKQSLGAAGTAGGGEETKTTQTLKGKDDCDTCP